MEKTLNMGAFEVLDNREMMEVDGGLGLVGYIVKAEKITVNFLMKYKDDVRGYNFLCR